MLLAAGDLPAAPEPIDVFVARAVGSDPRLAFSLAQEARRAGLSAQLELGGRSLKGQLKHADRIGVRYVTIVGEADVALKDMQSGEQRELAPGHVIPSILRGSRVA